MCCTGYNFSNPGMYSMVVISYQQSVACHGLKAMQVCYGVNCELLLITLPIQHAVCVCASYMVDIPLQVKLSPFQQVGCK